MGPRTDVSEDRCCLKSWVCHFYNSNVRIFDMWWRQTGRDADGETDRVFCVPIGCRGDGPGLAWLDVRGEITQTKTEKKEKGHNQWDPFCFSGNPLLPPVTYIHAHTQWKDGWIGVGQCVCLCVWLCVSEWLYLRQGSFCFKPEKSWETVAGPVIGLLRSCLAWEKPSSAQQCQANSCFQSWIGRTCWSEFRLALRPHASPPFALNTPSTN